MPQHPASPVGRIATAGLLLAYFFVAGWAAERLGGAGAPAPLIWPASGIGLALVLACGIRIWPLIVAVAVPAALVTVYDDGLTFAHVGAALLSGIAAAGEAVVAAWLIWRMTGETYLERASPFLLAMLIAAPLACFVAAIPIVLGQLVGGLVTTFSWVGLGATWHSVALSNWMGMLTLTPPLALWLGRMRFDLGLREAGELLALGSVSALVLASAPEQARYLLVAAHLVIAMRVPVKWTAAAVALSSVVYLSLSALTLRTQPPQEIHLFFLREVVFAFTLNVATYVTALLRSEAEERRARAEDLAAELTDAERRERQRIAQVLHDNLQQLLVAASMAVARLRRGDASAGDRAEELIRESIGNARTLSVELHPPVLDTLGLTAAVRWICEEAHERHGLTVQFESDDSPDEESPEVASFLVQATRELLLNAVKHSGGDTAWLRLRRTARWLELEVEDYGSGCTSEDLAQAGVGHFGLTSIRRRVELLGGRFDISTRTGCRIRLLLPRPGAERRKTRRRRAPAR